MDTWWETSGEEEMTPLDIWGHAGYVSLFIGSQLLARHNKWGWIARLVGELIWVVIGLMIGLTSIWMWGIFFIFFNDVYGFWKWNKDENDHGSSNPS